MIEGSGTAIVRRTPEEVLAFVLAFVRYGEADRKVGRVLDVRPVAGGDVPEVEVTYRARLAGLPGPVVRQVLRVTRPGRRVEVVDVPSAWSRLYTFTGVIEAEPAAGGARIRHVERLEFRPPLKWLLEPLLRRWIAGDVPKEVERLRRLLDEGADQEPLTS